VEQLAAGLGEQQAVVATSAADPKPVPAGGFMHTGSAPHQRAASNEASMRLRGSGLGTLDEPAEGAVGVAFGGVDEHCGLAGSAGLPVT
jgi:hypothetical protein